jgi:hypothetical protein
MEHGASESPHYEDGNRAGKSPRATQHPRRTPRENSKGLANYINAQENTAIGFNVLSVKTGTGNTAIGSGALANNTTDSFNVAINGGINLTDGIFNIDIANDGVAGESNTSRIGILQNRCFISGIRDVTTEVPDAINVVIDSVGQLGTVGSSRRFKDDVESMDQASEGILSSGR